MLSEVHDNYINLFIFYIPKSINSWNISDQQKYIFKQITKCVSARKGGLVKVLVSKVCFIPQMIKIHRTGAVHE